MTMISLVCGKCSSDKSVVQPFSKVGVRTVDSSQC